MLWLALYFPNLHLNSLVCAGSTSQQENSQTTAMVVINAQRELVQLNEKARGEGLQALMQLGTASAICNELRFYTLDESLEIRRLNELALQCYALSSDVVVREAQRCLLIEFSGMLKLYRDVDCYFQAVVDHLKAESVDMCYALAPSPLLAEILACWQNLLAKPCLFAPDAEQALSGLPIACLNIGAKTVQKLQRLGLETIGELLTLPDADLAMRLGKDFVRYLHQLKATAKPVLPRFSLPEYFHSSLGFDAEVQSASALLFPARRLFERMEQFLRRRSQTVQNLECLLYTRSKQVQKISLVSAHPESSAQHWHDLLRLKFDYVKLDAPVLNLELQANALLPLEVEAQDLFDAGVSTRSVAATLSRIEARLGHQSVLQPVVKDMHLPEQSFEYRAAGDARNLQKEWQVAEPQRQYAQQTLRPSLLLEEPQALAETVRIIHGPERIQTGWWQGVAQGSEKGNEQGHEQARGVVRDYFVALNGHKQLLWVFRDAEQQWFVHGLFA